jgi:hypothetical protein
MKHALSICLCLVLAQLTQLAAQAPARVDYARDIQPLVRANCYGCHGLSQRSGNFRMDLRRDVMPNRVGANNARIVPGNSGTSKVYLRISGTSGGAQMPPTGALGPDDIATIKSWIDQGADWPDELAGDTPSPPQDPQAVRLIDALRAGRRREFVDLLRTSPEAVRGRGVGGSTPLMYAALYGDAHSVRLLIDRGADVNARNDAGATALMWGVDDVQKTKVLLEHNADPNARFLDNPTVLSLAAGRVGATDVVEALVGAGARTGGDTAFARAVVAGDERTIRVLLERGAGTINAARDAAAAMRSGCQPCVDLVLASAAREARESAFAARAANEDDDSPLAAEAAALSKQASPVSGLAPRAALEKSLPLLQRADGAFLRTAGCVSCHNNSLFQMTAAAAGPLHVGIDASALTATTKSIGTYIESWRERVLQDVAIPGGVDTAAYTLVGLAAVNYPPDAATDALARFLWRRQAADGGWRAASRRRQPIESSDLTMTALSIRALQVYAPAPQKRQYAQAVHRGATWLRQAQARMTEDGAFQLLGLAWSREDRTSIHAAAARLIALQRADGGWSQIPPMASDAYATGQALTALIESRAIPAKDPAYQRGVAFLLRTQLDDGSWHVHSRAQPIQPYFDSLFPHERDQFISAAATNWAAMALAHAVRQ